MLHAALAFKGEWLGHNRNGERAHLAGQRSNDRRGARACASAEACRNEDHVGAFERFDNLVGIFKRSFPADLGIRACTQPVRQLHAELNLGGSARHPQSLQVGVGHNELDVLHAGVDHAVDGIVAAATDANDLDASVVAGFFVKADAESVVFHTSPRKISCQLSVVSSQYVQNPSCALLCKQGFHA